MVTERFRRTCGRGRRACGGRIRSCRGAVFRSPPPLCLPFLLPPFRLPLQKGFLRREREEGRRLAGGAIVAMPYIIKACSPYLSVRAERCGTPPPSRRRQGGNEKKFRAPLPEERTEFLKHPQSIKSPRPWRRCPSCRRGWQRGRSRRHRRRASWRVLSSPTRNCRPSPFPPPRRSRSWS